MATTFIYALCEPGTRTVRYIGKSDKPKKRFTEHLRTSVTHETPLGGWLRSLISDGKKPTLVVLREVSCDQRKIAEERYIRLAKGCGIPLVNGNNGGGGVVGGTPWSEVRRSAHKKNKPRSAKQLAVILAVNARKKGVPLEPKHAAKISAAMIGEKNHFFGHKHTKETLAKMWYPRSDEWRAAKSIAMTGHKHTEESKAKMRKPRSEESVAKQRATLAAKKALK